LLELEEDIFEKLSAFLSKSINMVKVIFLSSKLPESNKEMSKTVFTKAN